MIFHSHLSEVVHAARLTAHEFHQMLGNCETIRRRDYDHEQIPMYAINYFPDEPYAREHAIRELAKHAREHGIRQFVRLPPIVLEYVLSYEVTGFGICIRADWFDYPPPARVILTYCGR